MLAQQLRPGLVLPRGARKPSPSPNEDEDNRTAHDLEREQGLDEGDNYHPSPAETPIGSISLHTSVPSVVPPTTMSAAAVVQCLVSGRLTTLAQ